MCEEYAAGEDITWWTDGHGGGADPGDTGAMRLTGTVASVHRHPSDDTRIAAYLVERRGGVSGTYITTVRPDQHLIERVGTIDPARASNLDAGPDMGRV
jgi:hypothetical protein